MNLLQRRKILKNANYLDLTPVRMLEYRENEDGTVSILFPRFKSAFWREIYRNSKKGEYIFIHLDAMGSSIWKQIDGNKIVHRICDEMITQLPDKFKSPEDAEKRVTQFLSLLYRERYISFREILSENR